MVKHLSTRHLAVIASLLVMMTATAAEDFWFNDLHYVVTGNNTVALASHPDNPYAYSGETDFFRNSSSEAVFRPAFCYKYRQSYLSVSI
ncbi:MAG: hypothetical protein II043_01610 [Muribaculaceae bacterium]|nr:hypothetical protein [Muribaculaceae bacterium]